MPRPDVRAAGADLTPRPRLIEDRADVARRRRRCSPRCRCSWRRRPRARCRGDRRGDSATANRSARIRLRTSASTLASVFTGNVASRLLACARSPRRMSSRTRRNATVPNTGDVRGTSAAALRIDGACSCCGGTLHSAATSHGAERVSRHRAIARSPCAPPGDPSLYHRPRYVSCGAEPCESAKSCRSRCRRRKPGETLVQSLTGAAAARVQQNRAEVCRAAGSATPIANRSARPRVDRARWWPSAGSSEPGPHESSRCSEVITTERHGERVIGDRAEATCGPLTGFE